MLRFLSVFLAVSVSWTSSMPMEIGGMFPMGLNDSMTWMTPGSIYNGVKAQNNEFPWAMAGHVPTGWPEVEAFTTPGILICPNFFLSNGYSNTWRIGSAHFNGTSMGFKSMPGVDVHQEVLVSTSEHHHVMPLTAGMGPGPMGGMGGVGPMGRPMMSMQPPPSGDVNTGPSSSEVGTIPDPKDNSKMSADIPLRRPGQASFSVDLTIIRHVQVNHPFYPMLTLAKLNETISDASKTRIQVAKKSDSMPKNGDACTLVGWNRTEEFIGWSVEADLVKKEVLFMDDASCLDSLAGFGIPEARLDLRNHVCVRLADKNERICPLPFMSALVCGQKLYGLYLDEIELNHCQAHGLPIIFLEAASIRDWVNMESGNCLDKTA